LSGVAAPSSRSPSTVSGPSVARHQPSFALIEPSGSISA
jgi:hypothetical protein